MTLGSFLCSSLWNTEHRARRSRAAREEPRGPAASLQAPELGAPAGGCPVGCFLGVGGKSLRGWAAPCRAVESPAPRQQAGGRLRLRGEAFRRRQFPKWLQMWCEPVQQASWC